MSRFTKFALGAALGAFLAASPALAGSIEISDAIVIAPEGASSVGLFMTISNSGGSADRLYAVRTKAAAHADLIDIAHHEENRVIQTGGHDALPLSTSFEIGAGANLVLDEDGKHIELDDISKNLTAGDSFKLTLFFENAGPVKVTVKVIDDPHGN